ncbi:hypothetical protein AB1Y20_020129 [Prymnesium parvum]|uniref:RWD domain-containing protein n=1 Tax=Prymnesium parvum TaxID=97485 RepID=A0AB34JYD2_PRYPA
MEHAEEQAMELEALEAIYMEDFTRVEGADPPAFTLKLVPVTGAGDDVNHVCVSLSVAYTPKYPEAPPELKVFAVKGLDEAQLAELQDLVVGASKSEALAGTAMVYAIVEQAQEWLAQHNHPDRDLHAEMLARLEDTGNRAEVEEPTTEEQRQSLRDRVKAARKEPVAEGDWRGDPQELAVSETQTPVTVETFSAWRAKRAEMERKEMEAAAAAAGQSKKSKTENLSALAGLTGRQIFERSGGEELALQDAGMLEEGEEDSMALPREAVQEAGENDEREGDHAGGGDVLAEVGDEGLFEDDDLPEDLE